MTEIKKGLTDPEWLAGLVMVVVEAWWLESWRPVDRAIQRNRRAGLIQFTTGRKGGWSPVAS